MLFRPSGWVSEVMQLTYMSDGFRSWLVALAFGVFFLAWVADKNIFPRIAQMIGVIRARLQTNYRKKRRMYKILLEEMGMWYSSQHMFSSCHTYICWIICTICTTDTTHQCQVGDTMGKFCLLCASSALVSDLHKSQVPLSTYLCLRGSWYQVEYEYCVRNWERVYI